MSVNIVDMELDLIEKDSFHLVIVFGVGMSSSVHVDHKKKDILVLDKGPTQGLDGTTLTAEKKVFN